MTSLQKGFVLAAALVLALTVGGGAASAQDGEMVAIHLQNPHFNPEVYVPQTAKPVSFTRYDLTKAVGSTEGVTVDLAANTVRFAPGQYWFSDLYNRSELREIPAVSGQDSTGTTVEKVPTSYSRNGIWEWFVVVNGDGATRDDVKLGTVGRRMDFFCCDGLIHPKHSHSAWIFIRRLGD